MGIIIRQGLKATIASYVGVAIGAINNLYFFPMFLGKEGMGLMNIIYASSMIFLPFLQLGFPSAIIKFFPFLKDKPYLGSFISYTFILPLTVYGFFFLFWPLINDLFAYVFSENAELIYKNMFWVFPLTGILLLMNIFESFARVNYRIAVPTFLRTVVWRLLLSIFVFFIGIGFVGSDYLVPLYVLSWIIVFIISAIYSINISKLKPSFNLSFLKTKYLNNFNKFSGYSIPLAAGVVMASRIDQLMVASVKGAGAVGVLSLAIYFSVLIEIPKRSIISIIQPVLSNAFKNNNMDEVNELYKKSSLNLLLIGGTLLTLVCINIEDIFSIIPRSEDFIIAIPAVFFYGLAKLIDMGAGCNQEVIEFSKYYRVNLIFQIIFLVLVIITNSVLIPKYGITGAAIATCFSMFIFNLMRFIYVYKKMRIQPFSKMSFLVISVLFVFFLIGKVVRFDMHPIISILIKSAMIGIPLFSIFYFARVSKEINLFVDNFISKLKKK